MTRVEECPIPLDATRLEIDEVQWREEQSFRCPPAADDDDDDDDDGATAAAA